MDINQAKKWIESEDWYKQGSAIKPLYISFPWSCCLDMRLYGEKIKFKYKIAAFFKDFYMEDYISKKSLKNVANLYYEKQLKDGKFIEKLYKNWHRNFVQKYLRKNSEIMKQKFNELSDRELLKLFKEFTDSYLDVWHEVIFLDGFDYYGEIILEKIIRKSGKNFDSRDLEILTTPPKSSFFQQERLKTLDIAEKIKKAKIANKLANCKWLNKELKECSDKFYWIHNDFSSIDYLKPKYFYKNVISILKNDQNYKKEKEMRKFLNNIKINKDKIIKKYKLKKETKNIFEFISVLGNLRDERKSYSQMAGNVIQKFAEEIGNRFNLELEKVESMYYWEIENIFKSKKYFKEKLKDRMNFNFNILISSKKYVNFSKKEGKMLNDYINKIINKKNAGDLSGMSAYGGIVRGKVKIIKDKKEFHKMEKGDILVAPNTRPEYVPIMKMAKAIISEEGGITCHSAIVSRELKIPCVVGIQGIISVLKDGDLIEVDADKGIVRIIK